MEYALEEKVGKTIETLLERSVKVHIAGEDLGTGATEALKYTQAALNAAHVVATLATID